MVDFFCNVVKDMYDYVVNNGGMYVDNMFRGEGIRCGDEDVNVRRVFKYVFLDWDFIEF